MKKISLFISICLTIIGVQAFAELKANDLAPTFKTQTHEGKEFDLQSRKNMWTVLYFYPKAETPGCTKQACAFRDSIKKIRDQGASLVTTRSATGKI